MICVADTTIIFAWKGLRAMGDWFSEARYGMFLHWGAYAVGGRGEWVMNRERIPQDEYARDYVERFQAEHYDPTEWARLATRAGMGYLVLTARHHDGFCLWDTATTTFNAVRRGPKRDLIRPYVEAVRAAGLRVGLYYSVADWSHPDYPGAFARDWPQAWTSEDARCRFVAYYRAQIEELLTRYGPIDLLWFDGVGPAPLDGDETIRRIRELQPDILMNDRLGAPHDFRCSEQHLTPHDGLWEACITIGADSWGWHENDRLKTAVEVAESLVKTVKNGGNFLLNVGPRPDGTVAPEMARPLCEVGDWLRRNPGWLADGERSPFSWFTSGQLTVKGSSVFCHLFRFAGRELCLADIANPVREVVLLDGGARLPFEQRPDGRLFIRGLPDAPDPIATVLDIRVDGFPRMLPKTP